MFARGHPDGCAGQPDINQALAASVFHGLSHRHDCYAMTVLDDPIGATTAEPSDELIFLIASVSTDEQRKYATELFRHFARQVALDAYRLGQRSMAIPRLPAPAAEAATTPPEPDEAPAIQPSDDPSVSLIPPVRWQD
jgi:hypothetical protein